jgi:hypothetical protein
MNERLFNPPPAAVRPAEDPGAWITTAKAEHEAGLRAQRATLEHFRRAGEHLNRAKAAAGHGKWLPLLLGSGIPSQRSSEYMRLAAGWDKLPPGGNLTLKAALRVIDGRAEDDQQKRIELLWREVELHISAGRVAAMKELRAAHLADFNYAAAYALDPAVARKLLEEQGSWQADTEERMQAALRHGEGWQPTLKDADEHSIRVIEGILLKAGIPLDDEDDDSVANSAEPDNG